MPESQKIEIQFTSSDTFREIFQSSAEGILMVGEDGVILLANPVSEALFGYSDGELIGMPMENLIPQRLRSNHAQHRKQFNENPSPRRMGVGRDLSAVRKNGTEFPVEVSLSHKRLNEQLFIVAFIIDITERKNAEEAVKRSEEQLLIYAAELERKVQARTEELNKSIIELEKEVEVRKKAEEEAQKALGKERELNELKSKFVSLASHEFRTPLSTILSSASLVTQYISNGEINKTEKHLSRIKSNVNHLTGILNDFLSLGKLEEGKINLVEEDINLEVFFQEVLEEVKPILKEGQEIILNCDASSKTFKTDSHILRNIMFNLLSNASKYSDKGKNVNINCSTNQGILTCTVRDEGIGIPKDDLKHMFERFFRASNVTNIQGTGLGLNIVKRYVDLLDGHITFESIYEKGSTFTVSIPVL